MSGARDWRRIAGFRVVMSWPQAGYAPPPSKLVSLRARVAGLAGVLLMIAGAATIGVAARWAEAARRWRSLVQATDLPAGARRLFWQLFTATAFATPPRRKPAILLLSRPPG